MMPRCKKPAEWNALQHEVLCFCECAESLGLDCDKIRGFFRDRTDFFDTVLLDDLSEHLKKILEEEHYEVV